MRRLPSDFDQTISYTHTSLDVFMATMVYKLERFYIQLSLSPVSWSRSLHDRDLSGLL
jgi:hypothetical protein